MSVALGRGPAIQEPPRNEARGSRPEKVAMARRRRDNGGDKIETIFKLVFLGFVLLALAIDGIGGFAKTLNSLVSLALTAALAVGVLVVVGVVGFWFWKRRNSTPAPPLPDFTWHTRKSQPPVPTLSAWQITKIQSPLSSEAAQSRDESTSGARAPWTAASISEALGEIDWYQFEKFCAALLRADGYQVERKG
ncbi:MAG: hypothetical protein ABUL68_00800, partial [Pseudomonadota bacterium]